MLLSAVEAGPGIAVVSEIAARRHLQCGRIQRVDIEGIPPIHRPGFLTYQRSCTGTVPRRFLEFLQSEEGQRQLHASEAETA